MITSNISLDKIPDMAFINVVRKRDIQKARILSVKERKALKNGAFDVHLESPLGEKKTISRLELMMRYVYLSGKRIKISGWKANRTYIVMREDNTEALAIKIPTQYRVQVGNKTTNMNSKSQDYIICLKGDSNEIARETACIVSRELFRKMFTIREADFKDFCSHRGAVRKKSTKATNKIDRQPKISQGNVANASNLVIQNHKTDVQKHKDIQNNTYTAVGRLVNNQDKVVGFIVKDSKGMTRQVSKQEITVLCSKKLVTNIMLATKDGTGTKFLRGNGIKINELPATLI